MKRRKQTNLERVVLEVLNKPQGIADLNCSFKNWMQSPRTYISNLKTKHGIHLAKKQVFTENSYYTLYYCPNQTIAKKLIALANFLSSKRGEMVISAEMVQQILRQFPTA